MANPLGVQLVLFHEMTSYNEKRLLDSIGYIPPTEFEQMHYRNQPAALIEARLNQNGLRETRGGLSVALDFRGPYKC